MDPHNQGDFVRTTGVEPGLCRDNVAGLGMLRFL